MYESNGHILELSWRNKCTATYRPPRTVSETNRNEIPARPYTLATLVSETHFLLGELYAVYTLRERCVTCYLGNTSVK